MDDVVANFIDITGADHATAQSLLEATNYDLEQAVGLFFATHGDTGGAASGSAVPKPSAPMDDRGSLMPEVVEEQVRAPLPVLRDRLYGETFMSRGSSRPQQQQEVQAFRDFKAEGSRGRPDGRPNQPGLAGLFEPPHEIMFKGTFEEAKAAALDQSRWLLVNVQSNSEFASHQLNRDTWSDDTVKTIVKGSFIFWQVNDATESGSKVKAFYRITELPVTLVIDPVTGASPKTWTGAIDPQRLIEELVPFLDHDIHDPAALQLGSHLKRKHRSSPPPKNLTEEEEIALALAMSAEAVHGSSRKPDVPHEQPDPSVTHQSQPAEDVSVAQSTDSAAVEASLPSKSAAEVSKEALERLPPEPGVGDAGGCNLAVRFPDGRRAQRRFPRAAPLEAVRDFCLVNCEEAAAGRVFALSESMPGAPALGDMAKTLEEANLAGAMLVMRWLS
ncbi:UBX domain-containing protein 7 [Coccomyxa sp. Obi]|nr:UBX domain-containing protein 7 [Coccomyxa sp. Obi]